jgi:glutamate-1-semialdehyde 2,1-aminomutase
VLDETLACVLIDPLPNRAGLVPATSEFLAMLRRVTREIGALLVFDEVISFRLAPGGAQQAFSAEPDLTALGKVIGGGFPVGAVGGRTEIMQVFDPSSGKPALPHGGTFSANPVSMAAGRVAMELLDPAAFDHLDALGRRVREGVAGAFARAGMPGTTTGMGSLVKIHFGETAPVGYRSA